MTKPHIAGKLLVLLSFLLLAACNANTKEAEPIPHWFDEYSSFQMKDYQEYFNRELQEMSPDFVPYGAWVKQFYELRDGTPLWTLNGLQEHKVDTLSSYISDSYKHGLPSPLFCFAEVDSCIKMLKEKKIKNEAEALYETLFNLEMNLTESFLRYATAMKFGATDPRRVNGEKWLNKTQNADSLFVIESLRQFGNLTATLENMAPHDTNYIRLQQELVRLYPLKDTVLTKIPEKEIAKDHRDPAVRLVCQRLHLTGELSQSIQETDTLNDAVLAAVNLFRVNNAIPESDKLDVETMEKLNRPISYYVDRLTANMERMRWKVLPIKGDHYVAVNLPDFTLCAYYQGERVYKTNVCCGRTQNPAGVKDRHRGELVLPFKAETPLLYSEIDAIVLNPEWNIPYTITKDEYYPKLVKNNTAVIKKEDLYIVNRKTGKYVQADTIDWKKLRRNNLPYRLFQSSGRHNALGLIKFDFPNPESVYLHDTNNKGAFKRRVRALSHGCVRVQNPFELAAVIYELNGYDEKRLEELSIIVGNEPTTEDGEKYLEEREKKEEEYFEKLSDELKKFYRKIRPTRLKLEHTMPVYFEYYTCFVGDNGHIHYRNDLYYKDGNILYLIQK